MGIHNTLPVINSWRADFDEQAFIERLGCEEIPEDVEFKYWIVGYINKTAILSELNRQSQGIRLFEACLGLIEITVAISALIFLVNRWNDGERRLLIAKVIRNYLE